MGLLGQKAAARARARALIASSKPAPKPKCKARAKEASAPGKRPRTVSRPPRLASATRFLRRRNGRRDGDDSAPLAAALQIVEMPSPPQVRPRRRVSPSPPMQKDPPAGDEEEEDEEEDDDDGDNDDDDDDEERAGSEDLSTLLEHVVDESHAALSAAEGDRASLSHAAAEDAPPLADIVRKRPAAFIGDVEADCRDSDVSNSVICEYHPDGAEQTGAVVQSGAPSRRAASTGRVTTDIADCVDVLDFGAIEAGFACIAEPRLEEYRGVWVSSRSGTGNDLVGV